jgi:signal transduction histidine kinase
MRRRLVRKFVVVVAVAFAAIVGLSALIGGLMFRGDETHRGSFVPIGIVLVVLAIVLITRASRRFASTVGEVMEAADRVAAGDYAVRIESRGPREFRRLSRAFTEMAERLGTNEERRRQLLADVTHELRTPLAVIQANVEAIVDGLYPSDEAHLRPVLEETNVMSRLLDDLQTLSTAEAGALRLYREQVEPRQVVDTAVASFSAQANERGVRLQSSVAEGLPTVEVDPLRIGEVLANLLSNALRHTPSGGEVRVTAAPTPGGIEIAVSDTGGGIAPEQVPHVFDRFSRSPDSPGAGLGLAIAKSLVEAHDGTIRAESGPAGTTIRVTLPRQPAER